MSLRGAKAAYIWNRCGTTPAGFDMANNEIINRDSIRMAEAAANGNADGCKAIASDIWKQHPNDANYWNGV